MCHLKNFNSLPDESGPSAVYVSGEGGCFFWGWVGGAHQTDGMGLSGVNPEICPNPNKIHFHGIYKPHFRVG